MGKIGHGYGSEWHLLRYLGYHRQELNNAILKSIGELPDDRIEWLDFRFSEKNKKLRQDREWTGIDFLDQCPSAIPGFDAHESREAWTAFWPQTGNPPNWDAIGMLRRNDSGEILLVEAKAHTGEIRSDCSAGEKSRVLIRSAMEKARIGFGSTSASPDDWLERYYQFCNRLAVLYFLRQTCHVPARLIMIYFCGEEHDGWDCPQNEDDWTAVLDPMYAQLGLEQRSSLMSCVNKIFMPVHRVDLEHAPVQT